MVVPKLRFKADDGSDFPDWEEHKVGEFLTESNIIGHTGKEAKKLTVKLWGKGIVPKEMILGGSENTQYYIRRAGQLMYGKLDFLNCAFGIVPPELDGYESTLDAPAFDIHNILGTFLLSYITRKEFYKKNGDRANGSRKAKRIHPETFRQMSIMVPSLPEQQKIADFLSTIDTMIEKQRAMISAWEERKKGVMQKLFSQEVRFKADDGSDFPDWEEKKIGDVCSYRRGSFPQPYGLEEWYDEDNGKPFIQVADVNDNMRVSADTKRHISKLAEDKSVFVHKGTLIITLQGTIGRVAITEYDAYVDRTLLIVQDISKCLYIDYLKLAMQLLFALEKRKADGGIIKTITKETLTNFSFGVPSLPEQQKIADCLSALDTVIEKQKETLEKWQELKKGLLQQMFV